MGLFEEYPNHEQLDRIPFANLPLLACFLILRETKQRRITLPTLLLVIVRQLNGILSERISARSLKPTPIGNQLKRQRDFNLAIATYLKGTGLLQDTAKQKERLESFMIGVCSLHVREFDIIKYINSLFTLVALRVVYFHSKREPTPTHVPPLNA